MPTIHTRPSRIQHKSTFITGDNHYVLFCEISFHTDPVNLFVLGFDVGAENKVCCMILLYSVYFKYAIIKFQYSMLVSPELQFQRAESNLPSVWVGKALRQTIILCIAI